MGASAVDVTTMSLSDIARSLETGETTSTELVVDYVNRILRFDTNGARLSSVPIIWQGLLDDAMDADEARARGEVRGPLHGVPYTVKDSYMAAGMTMAAGSPAFRGVVAREDSFVVEQLRRAGAILLGRTSMPPMAAGGMQRGLYGRAESPYNADYLPAAWDSGSSYGSGVSTACSFAGFGMGEETVSSGRSPAANNGVVGYTPSRGVISVRGNWPLYATRDVVVPHTRSVDDLLTVLDAITGPDPDTRGDLWRSVPGISRADPAAVAGEGFAALRGSEALAGARVGAVLDYAGIRSGRLPAVHIRPSISRLFNRSLEVLAGAGAGVDWTPLPLRDLYDPSPQDLAGFVEEGLLPAGWMATEWSTLNAAALESFIADLSMSGLTSLLDVDPADIFPVARGSVDDRIGRTWGFYRDFHRLVARGDLPRTTAVPGLRAGLEGLEAIRERHFDQWMRAAGLDVLVFPTNADIGRADADMDLAHNIEARQDGTGYSNGNRMIRHLGIPTVTVPMGVMPDTGMPAGLTFAGPAGSDRLLLACALGFERAAGSNRAELAPPRAPSTVAGSRIPLDPSGDRQVGRRLDCRVVAELAGDVLKVRVACPAPEQRFACRLFVNGFLIEEWDAAQHWDCEVPALQFLGCRKLGVVALCSGRGRSVGASWAVIDVPSPALEGSLI